MGQEFGILKLMLIDSSVSQQNGTTCVQKEVKVQRRLGLVLWALSPVIFCPGFTSDDLCPSISINRIQKALTIAKFKHSRRASYCRLLICVLILCKYNGLSMVLGAIDH